MHYSTLHIIDRSEVNSPETFAVFCQQRLGTPRPTLKQMMVLRSQIKDFFVKYPHLDYTALMHITDWCRAKKKRPAHVYSIMSYARYAWADGVLPELDFRQRPLMGVT